jgi:hypothetical protein
MGERAVRSLQHDSTMVIDRPLERLVGICYNLGQEIGTLLTRS